VSVVVATRDRPEMLDGCLASLRATLAETDELIVVDSASVGAAAVKAVVEANDARYVRCDVAGASLARNVGWRAARGDLVAFIDDDTRVRTGWVSAVVAAFDDERVDFVTGRLDHANPDDPGPRPVAVYDNPDGFDIGPQTVEPYGHGANHAVRRAALDHIGGFDERLGAGGEFRAAEDVDLWDRLIGAGHVGRYVPEAVGWHVQWRRQRHYVGLDWSYGYGGGVRLAKLLRSDRPRARRSTRVLFWDWGARLTGRHLAYRQFFFAALTVIRMSGVVVGFARGIVIPLDRGHLAPRRRRGAPLRGDRPADRP